VTADGRVLRVRWCSACGTWYGAYYTLQSAEAEDKRRHTCQHCCRPCEFLDHWPNRHGECRAVACLEAGTGPVRRPEGSPARVLYRTALGPAQQELGL